MGKRMKKVKKAALLKRIYIEREVLPGNELGVVQGTLDQLDALIQDGWEVSATLESASFEVGGFVEVGYNERKRCWKINYQNAMDTEEEVEQDMVKALKGVKED